MSGPIVSFGIRGIDSGFIAGGAAFFMYYSDGNGQVAFALIFLSASWAFRCLSGSKNKGLAW